MAERPNLSRETLEKFLARCDQEGNNAGLVAYATEAGDVVKVKDDNSTDTITDRLPSGFAALPPTWEKA